MKNTYRIHSNNKMTEVMEFDITESVVGWIYFEK